MAAISAKMVKELRELTNAGMMDCKKALTNCDGDLAKAADWLRENGIAKAVKKAGRIAAEGLSKVVVKGNKACVVEINLWMNHGMEKIVQKFTLQRLSDQ